MHHIQQGDLDGRQESETPWASEDGIQCRSCTSRSAGCRQQHEKQLKESVQRTSRSLTTIDRLLQCDRPHQSWLVHYIIKQNSVLIYNEPYDFLCFASSLAKVEAETEGVLSATFPRYK